MPSRLGAACVLLDRRGRDCLGVDVMITPKIVMGCKPDPTRRTSPDSAWPLRGFDGLTWAERKALERERSLINSKVSGVKV